jgi:DNA mismatch repair ATPase MutS
VASVASLRLLHWLLQASKAAFVNKVQQCFAVKAQVDSFLDVSRATFCRLTENIHELADKYRQQTGCQEIKVTFLYASILLTDLPFFGKPIAAKAASLLLPYIMKKIMTDCSMNCCRSSTTRRGAFT